jgi:signal transduction histidine kinase
MHETELLRTIRPVWLHRVSMALSKGAGVRADLRTQLERFLDLIEQAIETGDPAWLDSVLSEWSASLTQSDLEGNKSNLTGVLKEMMLQTNEVCREELSNEQALDLIGILLPCFAHAFDRAASYETQVRVDYVSNQLNQMQITLEKLDRSKSDFIAVAAHELKTPLTLIEGYTAMLREMREREQASAMELELLNGINNGAHRLKGIIDDMIDVSLIDNNLLQLHSQPVWVNRLLSVIRKELEPAIQERCQTFEVKSFPGASEMTYGDPERLLQAFRNVLTNAVKYTPDGGQIMVDGRKLPGFLEIIVHDTGIGINTDDQTMIFEKFTRLGNISLHSSGKTKFKGGGPGLGLHITKGIIESHGGTIWVESPGYDEEKYPGSTFHILLPLLNEMPDSKMARLLSPLLNDQSTEEKGK